MRKLVNAKNFRIKDTARNFFDMYKYQRGDWLLLVFFRGEWCQHCRQQLKVLNRHRMWFEQHSVKIAAISPDNPLYNSVLKEVHGLEFPILSDSKWRIFKQYGFQKPNDQKKIKPALFIVNPQHQIVYRYIGKSKSDRPTISYLKKEFNKFFTLYK